ncbi:hypothetical protein ACH0BM_07995, partial [Kocuria rhizophila]
SHGDRALVRDDELGHRALHHHPGLNSQGKRHNQAIIALARRRTDVLSAMLRDGAFYTEPTPPALAA